MHLICRPINGISLGMCSMTLCTLSALVPVKYSISPSLFVGYFGLPAIAACCSTNSGNVSSSASEGTFKIEMYVYSVCFHLLFLKSGVNVIENVSRICNGSVQKCFHQLRGIELYGKVFYI